MTNNPYIQIIYYTRFGATKTMANLIARGVESISGIDARIRTVPPVSPTSEATEPSIPTIGDPYVTIEDRYHKRFMDEWCSGRQTSLSF
jgi:NAD(P)H dehydrogenase (quinone)